MLSKKADILTALQSDILRLQGFKSSYNPAIDLNLGPIREAFPKAAFPIGAVHEFLPAGEQDTAATGGFMAGLLSTVMGAHGTSLWVGASRTLFPPALKYFGLHPDRFIFVDLKKDKEVKWALEEALKCPALSAVVGELSALDFTYSRRLQLAVEKSQVTGFLLRPHSLPAGTTACVSRWKVASLPGQSIDDLPGVGFPQWKVELMRVRNGRPGTWEIRWAYGRFHAAEASTASGEEKFLKVG